MGKTTSRKTGAEIAKQIRVFADNGERGSELFQLLQENPAFDLRAGHLRTGDYIIEEQVTVERKTHSDFAIALLDGRLFRQAAKLSEASRPIILVEGPDERSCGVHTHALKGTLLSIVTAWRVPVVFSEDPAESAWMLETLGRQSLPEGPSNSLAAAIVRRG